MQCPYILCTFSSRTLPWTTIQSAVTRSPMSAWSLSLRWDLSGLDVWASLNAGFLWISCSSVPVVKTATMYRWNMNVFQVIHLNNYINMVKCINGCTIDKMINSKQTQIQTGMFYFPSILTIQEKMLASFD